MEVVEMTAPDMTDRLSPVDVFTGLVALGVAIGVTSWVYANAESVALALGSFWLSIAIYAVIAFVCCVVLVAYRQPWPLRIVFIILTALPNGVFFGLLFAETLPVVPQ